MYRTGPEALDRARAKPYFTHRHFGSEHCIHLHEPEQSHRGRAKREKRRGGEEERRRGGAEKRRKAGQEEMTKGEKKETRKRGEKKRRKGGEWENGQTSITIQNIGISQKNELRIGKHVLHYKPPTFVDGCDFSSNKTKCS